jgi:hypothetical protein
MKTEQDSGVRIISCRDEVVHVDKLTRFESDSIRPYGYDAPNTTVSGVIWGLEGKRTVASETLALVRAYGSAEYTNKD